MLKSLSACFCAAFLLALLTGCRSQPNLDLSNYGPVTVQEHHDTLKTGPVEDDNSFIIGPEEPIGQIAEKKDVIIGGSTGWEDIGTPLQLDGGNSSGLLNPERWTDCVVYFDYNQSEMPSSERSKVDSLINFLNKNPRTGVCIEGNTDERGSDEYNRSLGERRSISVKSYMVNCGIDESRIITISNGEDNPAITTATTEEDHKRNRRAEFVIGDLK